MLLVILLVAGSGYELVNRINDERARDYREAMARGLFHVLALDAGRHYFVDQGAWLKEAQGFMESEFHIVPLRSISLTVRERQILNAGNTVIKTNVDDSQSATLASLKKLLVMLHLRQSPEDDTGYADIYVRMPSSVPPSPLQDAQLAQQLQKLTAKQLAQWRKQHPEQASSSRIWSRTPLPADLILTTRMVKVGEKHAGVMARYVLTDLGHYQENEWKNRLQQLEQHFAFPLYATTLDKTHLDDSQRSRLQRREFVLALHEENNTGASSVRIYAPLGYKGDILAFGPLHLFEWLPSQMLLGVVLGGMLLISLGAWLVIRPLERRLKKVESTVKRIRQGDLAARVNIASFDEIGELAHTFNGMAEHIQRLIDTQREMTRAVSHELRTPVARLRFAIEMLADTDDAGARFQQLQGLDNDVEELNALIDEILTYSKLDSDNHTLQISMIDMHALMQKVQYETGQLKPKAQIEINDNSLSADLLLVEGEERYLHRVLQNFLVNAIRYASHRVRVSFTVQHSLAILTVEDDGPGIPEQDREKVFKPFARLDDSRTRASGGYGLGLSIVARIAFWHGGKVYAGRSSELGGARFTFVWPRLQTLRRELNEKERRQFESFEG